MRKIGFPDGEIADLNAGKVVARVIAERRPGARTCARSSSIPTTSTTSARTAPT